MTINEGGFVYDTKNNNAELSKIKTEVEKVKISNYIIYKKKKYDVISINEDCFKDNSNIKEIVLNKNITRLKSHQFANMTNLIKIDLANVVDISKSCFDNCTSLLEIKVNSIISDIYPGGFSHCASLTNIDLKSLNISYRAFEFCNNLEEISLPNTMHIETSAFLGCKKLKKIYIPKDCKMDKYVFLGNKNIEIIRYE